MIKKGSLAEASFEIPGAYQKDRTTERTDLAKDSRIALEKAIFMRLYKVLLLGSLVHLVFS